MALFLRGVPAQPATLEAPAPDAAAPDADDIPFS